jgi:hypothetical protein
MTPQPNPTAEDMADFVTPVAEMPAPPPQRQSKGLSFDFNGLIGRLQTNGFESLSAPQKELLYHLKENPDLQMSPEQMAMFVTETDKRLREQSTPKAQTEAQAAQFGLQKSKLDIEKLEKEKIQAAKDSAEVSTRKQLIFEKIDKYTNDKNPEFTPLNPLVGKWDGTGGAMLDAGGVNDKRAAQRAELDRLVSSDILELTKFLKPIAGTDLEFLRSMVPKIHQNETIWTDYLKDSKKVLEAMTSTQASQAPAQPAAQPQAAPAQPQQPVIRVIRGQTFVQQPNGKFIPQ